MRFSAAPFLRALAVVLAASCFLHAARAEVKLPRVFSDHMVLQREMAVPIWGTAAPDESVTVIIAGQTKTAKADAKGNWRVVLDPLKVGEPLTLTVAGSNTLTITDVLVGEVWIGSGQSNMDMEVKSYTEGDPALAKLAQGTYPKLRLMRKDAKSVWQEANPETIKNFSALLFSFGLPLQQELDVPVGLMVGAVGGTPSGYWLSDEMYRGDAACTEAVKAFAKTYDYDAAKAKYDADLAAWKPLAEAAKKEGKPVPRGPQAVGKAGETLGGKVGQLFESYIRPYVGYGIKGVLWDQGESKTNIVGVDQYTLMGALIKGWRTAWGQGDFPFLYVQKPSGGGVAWDDADPITSKASKRAKLPPAIPGPADPTYSYEMHLKIMKYPNTFMVTSTDLGGGIHPSAKSSYGARSARVALGAVYGREIEIYGPLYASHAIEGAKVRINFTHVGKGLTVRDGEKVQGFMIAGEDKKFVWADAEIAGESIVVSSASVPKPAAVRYAWSGQFPWANLFNKNGMPAQPFRTDDW